MSLFIYHCSLFFSLLFFFFNHTPTTDIYTLSLHDALPIYICQGFRFSVSIPFDRLGNCDLVCVIALMRDTGMQDRKSTRLNSSHRCISYAVFCLKKKKKKKKR